MALMSCSFVEVRERISESVAQISGSSVLLCEYRVFGDGRPHRAKLLESCLKSMVLHRCKRTSVVAPHLLKQQGPVSKHRANFARQVRACVRVVSLVGVREVGAEPNGVIVYWQHP